MSQPSHMSEGLRQVSNMSADGHHCSLQSQKQLQMQQLPLPDHEIYIYVLRVAILHHVLVCRRSAAALVSANKHDSIASTIVPTSDGDNTNAGTAASRQQKRESLRHTISEGGVAAWTSTFAGLSLGDLFRERGSSGSSNSSTATRYPERFVKVLESRLECISRGSDAANSDMLMRYTIGAFYGKYKDPKNARMFKEGRKMEDLLMIYIATATDVLRKRCEGDEWRFRLEGQVEAFVRILEECLRNRDIKHVPPDTFTKLEAIKTRISANRPPPISLHISTNTSTAALDSLSPHKGRNGDVSSVSSLSASSGGPASGYMPVYSAVSWSLPQSPCFSVSEMPHVLQVGRLFNVTQQQLQDDVDVQSRGCDEQAAINDFKALMTEVCDDGQMLPSKKDFPSEEAYTAWQIAQLADLQQEVLSLTRLMSSPATVTPTRTAPTSTASASNRLQRSLVGTQQSTSSHSPSTMIETNELTGSLIGPASDTCGNGRTQYAFVPVGAREAYVRLLDIMLADDLAGMADLDPSEEVPLRILSDKNQQVLQECALRWRVTAAAHFVYFLADMSQRYAAGEMPVVECIVDALSDYALVSARSPYKHWQTEDMQRYLTTLSLLFDALLRGFYETFSERLPREAVQPITEALDSVHDNEVFLLAVEPDDLAERLEQLREGIRRVCDFWYQQQCQLVWPHSDSQMDIGTYLDLLGWLKSTAKSLDKTFRVSLINAIDVPQLFLSRVPDLFFQDLQNRLRMSDPRKKASLSYTTSGATAVDKPQPYELQDGDIMHIYTGAREIIEMHRAFCPKDRLLISLDKDFEPYVLRWLDITHSKTLTWVRNAINVDDFTPSTAEDSNDHTSSIVDLIASCKSAVQYVTDLQWPDPVQNAIFLTRLSATISKAIEEYCAALEELFSRDMMTHQAADEDERDERASAWLTRAKALVQDKKLNAFQFSPSSCLKMNNIHAARGLLDNMYTAIDADEVAMLAQNITGTAARINKRSLYTIKIVLGEGLCTADGVSRIDPFVTLSDERGMRLAKTRTLYETSEPRWSEAFDISVDGRMWVAATVWNRNLLDEHELVGRTFVNLDPQTFGDYLIHDVWQDLDTNGRLLLRISMEGEKDDVQFYFGRAFRSLKRADNDMSRIVVDKISPFIRSCLSTSSLRGLLRQGGLAYITANVKNLKLERAFDRARIDNVRQMLKPKDPMALEIPLPAAAHADRVDIDTTLSPSTADRKKDGVLTDAEMEQPLAPLLDYLDQCLEVFRRYLNETAWENIMTKIWKEVLLVVESLLVPPLADQPTEQKFLTEREVDIVFKWLKFLMDFFYADGHGVPFEDLRNTRYRSIVNIRFYYDWSTDRLMEECVRLTSLQLSMLSTKAVARTKSVYQQRNLGTIKQRKQNKMREGDIGEPEMIMRILRMRPGSIDFIQQQLATLNLVQDKQTKPSRLLGSIRGKGPRRLRHNLASIAATRLPSTPKLPSQFAHN